MTRPLLSVAQIDGESYCVCGGLATFVVTPALLEIDNKFCGSCAVAYVLQYFKNNGVDLAAIWEVFPKLSAALEAPVSNLVM